MAPLLPRRHNRAAGCQADTPPSQRSQGLACQAANPPQIKSNRRYRGLRRTEPTWACRILKRASASASAGSLGTGQGARRDTKILPFPARTTQPHAAVGRGRPLPRLSAQPPTHRGSHTGTAGAHRQLPGNASGANTAPQHPAGGGAADLLCGRAPGAGPGRRQVTVAPAGRPSRRTGPARPRTLPARGARWDMESPPGGLSRRGGGARTTNPRAPCAAGRFLGDAVMCWGGSLVPPMVPRVRPRAGGLPKLSFPWRPARHGGARGGAAPRRPGPPRLRGARLQGTDVTWGSP